MVTWGLRTILLRKQRERLPGNLVPLLCQLIHERFSNKADKVGGNIFKDRRMEHRIGTLDIKNLIGNSGTRAVEIKKELSYKTRKLTEVFWTL